MRFWRQNFPPFLCGVIVGVVGLLMLLLGPIIFPGSATVIDGDNLRISGYNVRLAGLDAPELPTVDGRQCRKHNPATGCHNASSSALAKLVKGRTAFCLTIVFDWRNWRPVVICKVGDIEINAWLITNCHAGSPKDPAHRIEYYEEMVRTRTCVTRP